MNRDQTMVTRNLINFCYTCDEARNCTTERQCIHCWAEHNLSMGVEDVLNDLVAVEEGNDETVRLLRLYAE
jgi:hypothetical protein